MNKKNIRISIIIPHYNSTTLLIKLLESIPINEELEVIVVDDSSDESLDELQSYLNNVENRFLYINDKSSKGAGTCRNIGLTHVNGEWVLFADADDFFVEGWLGIVEQYLDRPEDIVYFIPHGIELETNKVSTRHLYYKSLICNYLKKRNERANIQLRSGFCTPWSKLYRRELISKNNIWFDEVMVSNDIMFATKTAFTAKNIEVVDETIYCVTRSKQTLTSKKSIDNFMTRVEVYINRYKYLEENLSDKEFRYAQINRYGISKLITALIDGGGFKVSLQIWKMYRKNGIKVFTWSLLNPFLNFNAIINQIKCWVEITKFRKNK